MHPRWSLDCRKPGAHTQSSTRVLPDTEVEFPAHARHTLIAVAPVCAEYVPAAQLTHVVLPGSPEYFPGPQLAHAPSADAPATGEYFPALQFTQVFSAAAPVALEYLPAAQLVQTEAPASALYFPASHAVHVPPSGPVYP